MRKIDNRQYKLAQIKSKRPFMKTNIKARIGRRRNARLDRRGTK